MKRFLTVALLAVATMTQAQQRIDLWPQGAPHVSSDRHDTAFVKVFLAPASGRNTAGTMNGNEERKSLSPCIVICPGGGYTHLAIDHEGYDWAPLLNKLGISVVVLKYRMPHGVKEIPIEDAEEAVRLVRSHAEQWAIDPQQVGIMGFSAGGHLAATVATHALGKSQPNFQVLFYPVITMDRAFTHMGSHDALLGTEAVSGLEWEYSNEHHVTARTPRAFLALSDDDHVVPPLNGVSYYVSLNANRVPATLHVYPTGDHGWGMRSSFAHHAEMLADLTAWLKVMVLND